MLKLNGSVTPPGSELALPESAPDDVIDDPVTEHSPLCLSEKKVTQYKSMCQIHFFLAPAGGLDAINPRVGNQGDDSVIVTAATAAIREKADVHH